MKDFDEFIDSIDTDDMWKKVSDDLKEYFHGKQIESISEHDAILLTEHANQTAVSTMIYVLEQYHLWISR